MFWLSFLNSLKSSNHGHIKYTSGLYNQSIVKITLWRLIKMKKIILVPLMFSVVLSTTSMYSFAKTQTKLTQATKTKITNSTPAKVVTLSKTIATSTDQKINGTIEKITESEMIVKTKDSKSYFIPIMPFSNLDDYKKLDLKAGMEVSITGFEAPAAPAIEAKGDIGFVISSAAPVQVNGSKTITSISSTNIKSTAIAGVKSIEFTPADLDGKIMFMPEEITSDGKTVKLSEVKNKFVTSSVAATMPEEIIITGAIDKITDNDFILKTKDNKTYLVPTLGFSELDNFKKLALKAGMAVSLKGFEPQTLKAEALDAGAMGTVICSEAIPAEKITTLASIDFNADGATNDKIQSFTITSEDLDGKIMFMPNEITSNGVTVKLFKDIK